MKHSSILIGIAGGTGSGKTSIAREIIKEFTTGEVTVIQLDSYYKDLDSMPLEERNQQNFDHPDAMDFELLHKHLSSLMQWETVNIPSYDFSTHTRKKESAQIDPHHVLVVEGILTLWDAKLRELMDIKLFVETPDDIRFIRRLTRDREERERTTQSVIDQYLHTVRPMHEQFVEPMKVYADLIIPEGGKNKVAIDLIRTKIKSILPGQRL
ncbi:MAG: uridine kinase [Candidatus Marinimicrobia bacterium]|jgi:uridine kinase|nr:uridine kinase [Candidatus Neomarinimicrobiota bacterium]MDP6275701.1 uridine kinase [Candidatus Neomarinimicrobiota bacterium]MDP7331071.1 uridine kinase [Candidatus Neomarinimicrobiota bacterium]HBN45490.1 uridine kinase [Candidatus Neomarinimicrobiota bacterium]HJL74482.1 uridine kinase [Candidatus Neomarinimicrobiota bacterium]|tara:strand:- start:4660 stop:5292 length:633 start_codon:yes stop_codon:yes gene_type:complete